MSTRNLDPGTVFLIEMIPGFFGFLGVGYLYLGRTQEGLVRLIGFLAGLVVLWTIAIVLAFVVIGLCMMPFLIAAQIGIPIWSGMKLRRELEGGLGTLPSSAPAPAPDVFPTLTAPQTFPSEPASQTLPTEPAGQALPTELAPRTPPTEPASQTSPTEPAGQTLPTEPAPPAPRKEPTDL